MDVISPIIFVLGETLCLARFIEVLETELLRILERSFEHHGFGGLLSAVSLLREGKRVTYRLLCSLTLKLHIRIIFLII